MKYVASSIWAFAVFAIALAVITVVNRKQEVSMSLPTLESSASARTLVSLDPCIYTCRGHVNIFTNESNESLVGSFWKLQPSINHMSADSIYYVPEERVEVRNPSAATNGCLFMRVMGNRYVQAREVEITP